MKRPLIVFFGGGIGAGLRGLLLAWLNPLASVVPLPVLLANLLGAFILGVVYVLADEAGLLRAEPRLFLAVGVLGGFTTFSTLGWGADMLLSRGAGDIGAAMAYLLASVVGGVIAVGTGLAVGREVVGGLGRVSGWLPVRGQRDPHDVREDMETIEAENREERI